MANFRQLLSLIVVLALAGSCADETIQKDPQAISKESITGFWTYKKVLINNVDLEVYIPGFTVSNFLHLKDDDSYGKCYILGEWSLSGADLKLNQHFTNQPVRHYTVIAVSENSLTLQIKLKKSEYEIGISQFDENETITVTEIFER
jgi:hypothetical protein